MAKRINSNIYLRTRIVFKNNEFYIEECPNGCLYSHYKYKTSIRPEDLPKSFIKGRYYKNEGYVNAAGVTDIVYVPDYHFNHSHKYDTLYVSYKGKIVYETVYEKLLQREVTGYQNYDFIIDGYDIVNFIVGIKKYSPNINTKEIEEEIIKKEKWFMENWPQYCANFDMMHKTQELLDFID